MHPLSVLCGGLSAAPAERGSGGAVQAAERSLLTKHKPLLFRAGAIGCIGMSALVAWCEATIILTGPPRRPTGGSGTAV